MDKIDTKKCSRCGADKNVDEFSWRIKAKGIRESQCKSCKGKYLATWYDENKDEHYKRIVSEKNVRRAESRRQAIEYLQCHPCVDCDEKDIVVLQFDHVCGEKKYNVASMIADGYAWEAILKEIAKCVVRCANCHTRRTASINGNYKVFGVPIFCATNSTGRVADS